MRTNKRYVKKGQVCSHLGSIFQVDHYEPLGHLGMFIGTLKSLSCSFGTLPATLVFATSVFHSEDVAHCCSQTVGFVDG